MKCFKMKYQKKTDVYLNLIENLLIFNKKKIIWILLSLDIQGK